MGEKRSTREVRIFAIDGGDSWDIICIDLMSVHKTRMIQSQYSKSEERQWVRWKVSRDLTSR